MGVEFLDALNAKGLPDRLRVRSNRPDLPIGRLVRIAVGVAVPDGLHVHVSRIDELTIGLGFGDHGRGQHGGIAIRQADDVDKVDPSGLVGCSPLIDRESPVRNRHDESSLQGQVTIRGRIPEVDVLHVDRVQAVVVGGVSHRDHHLVPAIGQGELPELPLLDVDERVEALIGSQRSFS